MQGVSLIDYKIPLIFLQNSWFMWDMPRNCHVVLYHIETFLETACHVALAWRWRKFWNGRTDRHANGSVWNCLPSALVKARWVHIWVLYMQFATTGVWSTAAGSPPPSSDQTPVQLTISEWIGLIQSLPKTWIEWWIITQNCLWVLTHNSNKSLILKPS